MLFEISEENCAILFTNSISLYVIGIGETDYTIHRDAREIFNWYQSNKPQYWYNIVDNKFHITHYFAHNLQTIYRQFYMKVINENLSKLVEKFIKLLKLKLKYQTKLKHILNYVVEEMIIPN